MPPWIAYDPLANTYITYGPYGSGPGGKVLQAFR